MPTERTEPLASRISSRMAICVALVGLLGAGCDRPNPDSGTTSSSSTASSSAAPGVIFTADPNPVPPGNPKGRTTITWDTGSDAVGEVYVVNAGNERLF